jgi:ubiquinone/menaquinone biosynthesis C-methylase UbiE
MDPGPGPRRRPSRAARRSARLGIPVTLLERDVRATGLPEQSFDAVVASFLFCTLEEEDQLPALRELARICKLGAELRVLEHTRPPRPFRRFLTRLWEP